LFELLLDSETSVAMVLHTADIYQKSEKGNESEEKLLRILTPILKGSICKRARYLTGEAMEVRGGNGYIEDWVNPKLVRYANLGYIWEGSTNIMALEILRSLKKDRTGEVFFRSIYERIKGCEDTHAVRVSRTLKYVVDKIYRQTERLIEINRSEGEYAAKQLMKRVTNIYVSSLLWERAEEQINEESSYRNLLLVVNYLYRYLFSNGYDEITLNDQCLFEYFDEIVNWETVPSEP